MKILKSNLLTVLDKTASLASRRTTLPSLMSLKIEANDNTFSISATDLNCYAVASCECDGELAPACVPATAFNGLARSAKDEIELMMDGTRLKFISNGVAMLSLVPVDEFPPFPSAEAKSLGISCDDLADCIEGVAWAATSDDEFSRPFTAGVWCKLEPKRMRTASTNGKHLALMDRAIICADAEFVLQAKYAPQLCSALREKDAMFSLSTNCAIVKSPTLTLAVKLIDHPFPNVYGVIDQEQVKTGVLPVQEIIQAIDNATMISGIDKFCNAELRPVDGGCEFVYLSANEYRTTIQMTLPRPMRFGMALLRESLSKVVADCPKISLGISGLFVHDSDLTICTALLVEKKRGVKDGADT